MILVFLVDFIRNCPAVRKYMRGEQSHQPRRLRPYDIVSYTLWHIAEVLEGHTKTPKAKYIKNPA